MHTNGYFVPLLAALPEITLMAMTLLTLLIGAFSDKSGAYKRVAELSLVSILVTCIPLILLAKEVFPLTAFSGNGFGEEGLFVLDAFGLYVKALLLVITFFLILIVKAPLERLKADRFEFYTLMLFSLVGMMIAVSTTHLLVLYMGLELMSFPLYILAAFKRENARSSEAGLKYFVMGSLASGLLLFGMSYLYGITGALTFEAVSTAANSLAAGEGGGPLLLAMVFMLAAIAFKLSAAPFHMWTPDVYQGAPTPVTAFMASASKIAVFAVLLRVLFVAFAPVAEAWLQIVVFLAVVTMGVGAYMAIVQHNIKRLLAYSSIGHVGFMLVGLAAGEAGVQSVLIYLTIYSITILGAFGVLMLLRKKDVYLETLEDLSGLWYTAPYSACMLLVFLFSIAGVPPLAGFFAKFYVFTAAVGAGYTWLAVVGVLFSVISAYYVLKVVKTIFFETPASYEGRQIDVRAPRGMYVVLIVSVVFSVGYIFVLQPFDGFTRMAASSLVLEQSSVTPQQTPAHG